MRKFRSIVFKLDVNCPSTFQERFLLQNSTSSVSSESMPLWWIPITYTSEQKLDFNKTRPSYWMKAEQSLSINDLEASPSQWVILNIQQTGVYFFQKL